MGWRCRAVAALLPVLCVAATGALALPRARRGSVVPFVDCVVGTTGTVKVYFGYVNEGGADPDPIRLWQRGRSRIGFQGQPTIFNHGTYERVFAANWNTGAFTGIAWELDGNSAVATFSGPIPSQQCVAGATGPVSDLGATEATLNGVAGVAGQQTTYHFEYGAGADPDTSTAPATVGPGPQTLVQHQLTGLTPAALYRYRLVATNGDGTTVGELRSFSTPAAPAPETEITKGPIGTVRTHRRRARVSFEFTSDDPGVGFECSLDAKPFEPCASPFEARVGKGAHIFAVRARQQAGKLDPAPAERTFKVRRKRR